MEAKRIKDPDNNPQRMEDIKALTISNPVALGQVLINNPENAKIVCGAINDIEKDDQSHDSTRKAFIWGGMIVGGALVLTGIGSGVGMFVFGAGASAAAAGTTVAAAYAASATLATASTAAGVAAGLKAQ